MPVQEFECQIARGQIGRYLNGEGLSSEALRQLGAHVAECSECKTFLDHRKAALQGMLGEAPMPQREAARAVVDVKPSEALIAQIRARSVEDEPAPAPPALAKPVKPMLTKPIIYCGILGVVLVGMTYLTRNPSGLLGPHASQIVASAPPAAQPPEAKAIVTPPDTPKIQSKPPAVAATTGDPKPVQATDAKTPAPGTSESTSSGSTPTTQDAPPKPGPSDKPVAEAIAPTKTSRSPFTVDPNATGQKPTTGTDAAESRATPKAANVIQPTHRVPSRRMAKPKWRGKTAGHPHWTLHHLRPGTGAIHVYRS